MHAAPRLCLLAVTAPRVRLLTYVVVVQGSVERRSLHDARGLAVEAASGPILGAPCPTSLCRVFSFFGRCWATSGRQTGGSPQLGLGAVRAASLRACEPAPVAEVAVRRSAETWPQSAVQRASDELRASKATKRSSRLQRRRARARSGAGVCQRARTPAQNGAFPLHCHRHSKALNPCTLEPFSPRVLLR